MKETLQNKREKFHENFGLERNNGSTSPEIKINILDQQC